MNRKSRRDGEDQNPAHAPRPLRRVGLQNRHRKQPGSGRRIEQDRSLALEAVLERARVTRQRGVLLIASRFERREVEGAAQPEIAQGLCERRASERRAHQRDQPFVDHPGPPFAREQKIAARSDGLGAQIGFAELCGDEARRAAARSGAGPCSVSRCRNSTTKCASGKAPAVAREQDLPVVDPMIEARPKDGECGGIQA